MNEFLLRPRELDLNIRESIPFVIRMPPLSAVPPLCLVEGGLAGHPPTVGDLDVSSGIARHTASHFYPPDLFGIVLVG